MLLKCVTSLLLHLFYLGNSQSVVGPTTYVIGNTFNLTWNSTLFSSQTVNISLTYDGGQLMLANVPNNGSTLSQQPSFHRNLSHLLVPDNSTGKWTVSDSSVSYSSNNNVQLYQPLMFETMGRVLDLNNSFSISVTLNQQIQFTSNFNAFLVFLDSRSLWNATYMFQITDVNFDVLRTEVTLTLTFPNTNLVETRNYYLVVFANNMSFSGINGGTSFSSWSNLFVPYDSSQVMISLESNRLVPYSSVGMNVSVGSELEMSYLYIGLKDHYFSTINESDYIELQCNSSMASQYNQFGWLFDDGNSTSSYGNYTMELYYNPMTTFDDIAGDSSYRLYTYGIIEIEHSEEETPAIMLNPEDYMDNDNKSVTIKKGDSMTFHITSTAFNFPVKIYADWVQYYYGTEDPPIVYKNTSITITERVSKKKPQKLSTSVPKNAVISNETNKEITLRLYTVDCEGNPFGFSKYVFSLKKKSHSTNKLSAGAIVGIVCAGVLICGLAAWYLAMSRHTGSSDGYSELDKD